MSSKGSYEFFSSLQCNVCLLLNDEESFNKNSQQTKKPRKCSGCSLIWYCQKEHQVIDWKNHRKFCLAIQKIMKKGNIEHPLLIMGEIKTLENLEEAILGLKFLLRHELDRRLEFHEEQLTSFPGHCAVCYGLKILLPCEKCYAVAYCSKEHATQHSAVHNKVCNLLSLYYCPYKVKPVEWNTNIDICNRIKDLEKTDLYGAFESATLKKLPDIPTESLRSYQMYSAAADFSCIGTICLTMQFFNMRAYKSNKYTVYVIGATVEQDMWFREQHTKFFFSQYPQITHLELYFIGPEVVGETERSLKFVFEKEQRWVTFKSFAVLFQNYCQDNFVNPSMIAVFNCGFSEYASMPSNKEIDNNENAGNMKKDTWSNGLLEILRTYNVPFVFTSFSSLEAKFDYAAVLRVAQNDDITIGVKRIFGVTKNPYRDFRPLRNMRVSDKEEIYYRNGYIQGVITNVQK